MSAGKAVAVADHRHLHAVAVEPGEVAADIHPDQAEQELDLRRRP